MIKLLEKKTYKQVYCMKIWCS